MGGLAAFWRAPTRRWISVFVKGFLATGALGPPQGLSLGALRGSALDHRTKIEQCSSFVPDSREAIMVRAVVEEAAALASISLFIGMLAVWVQVFSAL